MVQNDHSFHPHCASSYGIRDFQRDLGIEVYPPTWKLEFETGLERAWRSMRLDV